MAVQMTCLILVSVVCLGSVAAMAIVFAQSKKKDAAILSEWSKHCFALKAPQVAQAEIEANNNLTQLQRERLAWETSRMSQLRQTHTNRTAEDMLGIEAGIVASRVGRGETDNGE